MNNREYSFENRGHGEHGNRGGADRRPPAQQAAQIKTGHPVPYRRKEAEAAFPAVSASLHDSLALFSAEPGLRVLMQLNEGIGIHIDHMA